jgi:HK97 family phage major capsid protein
MPFPALEQARGKLQAKQDELGRIFAEAGENLDFAKVKSLPAGIKAGDTRALVDHVAALNDEMTDLADEVAKYLKIQNAAEQSTKGWQPSHDGRGGAVGGDGASTESTFGELFLKSKAYRDRLGAIGPEATIDIELKTLMTTTAGWAPEYTRTGRLVEQAQRPIQVTDLIPQTTTTQAAVQYMEETTFTNLAAEVAEGGTYPESALALTERTSVVRKVATFLPVTEEQLEDEPRARAYVNNRLPFMVRQRLDSQILVGSGVAPNLLGVLNVTGIQTQAKGTDPVPDAVYKALVLVRVTGRAIPNAFVVHPLDWQDIRLLRTADGLYIWGNPSDPGPERIWGLGVTQTDAITQNTGLVGDFANFSELAVRRGIDVQVSNSHSTFFVEGKLAIRADIRAAAVWYRPAAFCTVTGI